MRSYCRPGATPLERLEALVASHLCSQPQFPPRVADLLIRTTGSGPARASHIRHAFSEGSARDPAEALGMSRALLLLCGVAPERRPRLTGRPGRDLARLIDGEFRCEDPADAESYALPSLLEAYCHMGAGFARGVDRVFHAVSGRPLSEHLHRALELFPPPSFPEPSSG